MWCVFTFPYKFVQPPVELVFVPFVLSFFPPYLFLQKMIIIGICLGVLVAILVIVLVTTLTWMWPPKVNSRGRSPPVLYFSLIFVCHSLRTWLISSSWPFCGACLSVTEKSHSFPFLKFPEASVQLASASLATLHAFRKTSHLWSLFCHCL